MSPNPLASGPVRPAAVVNEDIRALWPRAGRELTAEERAEYERLLEEWAAAMRAEVVEAA
ncbi:hypothetical protein ACFC01_18220 [Streptomyces mirabilis]|uniref:hypothetical protein n=1 Tax=Streptomyces mirabilis TaxID=68239 RepID=UPI0035D95811